MHKVEVGVLPPMPIGRILLVGSWPAAIVTRRQLAELEGTGCVVRWLSKGEEWREAVDAFRPHVILVNATPSEEDAAELCLQIRSVSEAQLLVILDEDSVARRIRLLETGADDVVPPEFSPDELIARVRYLLRRAMGYPPRALHFEERASAELLYGKTWRISGDERRWLRSLPTVGLRRRWDG